MKNLRLAIYLLAGVVALFLINLKYPNARLAGAVTLVWFIALAVRMLVKAIKRQGTSVVETISPSPKPPALPGVTETVIIPGRERPPAALIAFTLAALAAAGSVVARLTEHATTERTLVVLTVAGVIIAFFAWRRSRKPIVVETAQTQVHIETDGRVTRYLMGKAATVARKQHRGKFGAALTRLALWYIARRLRSRLKTYGADDAAQQRKFTAPDYSPPPLLSETTRDNYARLWRAMREIAKRMRDGHRQGKTRKSIEERPVRMAKAKVKRQKIAARAEAIEHGVPSWKARVRTWPVVGRLFGSNEQDNEQRREHEAEEQKPRHDKRNPKRNKQTPAWRKPAAILLGIAAVICLLGELIFPKMVPGQLLGVHFLFLLIAGWAWFWWRDCERVFLRPFKFGLFALVAFVWIATTAAHIGLERKWHQETSKETAAAIRAQKVP